MNYIELVVNKIISNNKDLLDTILILPSKRSVISIKREFKRQSLSFNILPNIISIEDFIFDVSKINKIDNIQLLFEFYKVYLKNTKKDKIETFEDFHNWANILIKDFNEIDSYLIDPTYIFSYLKDINRIDNWFKNNKDKSELSLKYINFFNDIEVYYTKFYERLLIINAGYQGLQYREASKNIDLYIENNKHNFIFIGFNALNQAEELIIQKLLKLNIAKIYFDVENVLINENISATHFIKKYETNWSYFRNKNISFKSDFIKNEKDIEIIGVPKNITQIKYANEIIEKELSNNEHIALVLANEKLLLPTINSLPKGIKNINITMGLPVSNSQVSNLFNLIFKLHRNKNKLKANKFYYKDVLAILNHPSIQNNLNEDQANLAVKIKNNNLIFIDENLLKEFNNDTLGLLNHVFSKWTDVLTSLNEIQSIISILKKGNNQFENTYLDKFEIIFNQILNMNEDYNYIANIETLHSIYNQLISNETLSFKGDATKGLQIMGMLETRVIEFDTLILTSVNEGFLPSGKSGNSFIPFDIKHEIGLPTYREKDAIFSYHFFRLIARSKKIYLIYNTETDDFGSGEQSRFLTQLELLQDKLPNLKIKKSIISPKISNKTVELKTIKKDNEIINKLMLSAKKGFSPTALSNYIYNPIAFYRQKILGIYQLDEVEETIAHNTLGTVIHNVLEEFYIPFKNTFIKIDDVLKMKTQIHKSVLKSFEKVYENGKINKGKNLLIFEVAKQFINNFLNQEITLLKQGKQLKIIDLEIDLESQLYIDKLGLSIKIKGQADRIDILDGVIRIIDYKTGKVEQKNLNIANGKTNNWNQLTKDYKYSKAFQVLMYAYMYVQTNKIDLELTKLESGIVSFKNLKSGFLKVNKSFISKSDLALFEDELTNLFIEIFNKDIPFKENENLPF